MKSVFLGLVLTLLLSIGSGLALADPFLVCDPQAGVTSYSVTGDINVTVPATSIGALKLDLVGLSNGTYQIDVRAINEWGESVATPFVFTKVLPDAPVNVRIE